MSRQKPKLPNPNPEKLELTELHCKCCRLTFYGNYSNLERCYNCGSTDEVMPIRNLTVIVQKSTPYPSD